MVGAGALGCEYMKGFALMGLGTRGKITITDNDSIALSNLNRQFLFRTQHIDHMKSEVAAQAASTNN